MINDYRTRFNGLITNAKHSAVKIRTIYNESIMMNDQDKLTSTLVDLEVEIELLFKEFSESYNLIKESSNISQVVDEAIIEFVDKAYNKKNELTTFNEYGKFSKFIMDALSNISQIEARESNAWLDKKDTIISKIKI
jgi:hypothetical protein